MKHIISVKGPTVRGPIDTFRVQWNMGNPCNYSCEYCPPILHNGSKPWLNKIDYINTIEQISSHYNASSKRVDYELIGGEVTVIPGFEDIIRKISEYNTNSVVYSNASRTIKWWSKAKQYLDGVVLTYHPLTQHRDHFTNVLKEIMHDVTISINIAGIGGKVEDLGDYAEYLRSLFKDCSKNPSSNISICVKTMYKKQLNGYDKQQYFYDYTQQELDVLNRPGIVQTETTEKPNNDWMTEIKYSDGSVKYVQSHQLVTERLNNFYKMKCHLGYESINIDPLGEVYGSWCGSVSYGNIKDITDWNLANSYTTCPHQFCNNISDTSITKTV
tara:strand:- start:13491 stop:14477 length:987 start_codon:yes stop_codon:yes gene_type:complete